MMLRSPVGSDSPKEACGVFGICAPGSEVARISFFALYALQHRGQESAGIATTDGRGAYLHKGMGLVAQVFKEKHLRPLKGHLAIGHNRYSTTGSSQVRNAQPYVIETIHGPLGVGHNGNLTNASQLRERLLKRGVGLISSSDSEVIIQSLAAPPPGGEPNGPDWVARIRAFMQEAQGAYSLVILTRDAIYAVRDSLGLRPLCLGIFPPESGVRGSVVASESCALGTIAARYVREVEPGEIVRIDEAGFHSFQGLPRADPSALCVFEYVYFARPDSTLEGQTVNQVRWRLGRELAREAPASADLVLGVPDSARPAAIGYSYESKIPYGEGLIKNRYIGRTFIEPTDRLRRYGVQLKYNPLESSLKGRRVVLVDDSIVRGNTAGPLVRMLREGGAAEVHVRVSSPPIRHPCFMGVDMATYAELIAHKLSIEQILEEIDADSLAYLSHPAMIRAVTDAQEGPPRHCSACFTGDYPLPLEGWWEHKQRQKNLFEGIQDAEQRER